MRSVCARPLLVFITAVSVCFTLPAQILPKRSELRSPLDIVHPFESVADVQRELNDLEARSRDVDRLLGENTTRIWKGADKTVSGLADTIGVFFGKQAEYEAIKKNLEDAASHMTAAAQAELDAKEALRNGQLKVAIDKTREAILLGGKAKAETKEAHEQTTAIVKRTYGVVSGRLTPNQIRDLVHRLWESRHDLSSAAKGYIDFQDAGKEHDLLIQLKHDLNDQLGQLVDLKRRIATEPGNPSPGAPSGPPAVSFKEPPESGPTTTPATVQPPPDSGMKTTADPGANPPPVTPTDSGMKAPSDPGINPPPVTPTDSGMKASTDPGSGTNPSPIAPAETQTPKSLESGGSNGTGSSGWCNGDWALCQSWHDGGDRAAFGNPANSDTAATAAATTARQQFYDQNPQLKPFQETAAWSSPATEVDDAVRKGVVQADGNAGLNAATNGVPTQLDSSDGGVAANGMESLPTRLDDGSVPSDGSGALPNQGQSSSGIHYLDTNPLTQNQIASMQRAIERANREANTPETARVGRSRIDWWNVLSTGLQILDAGIKINEALNPPGVVTYRPPPVQTPRPNIPNTRQPLSPGAKPNPVNPKPIPSPGSSGTNTPQQTPTPLPGQNCTYVPNPAAQACAASPLLINGLPNYCAHEGGNPMAPYIPLMILKCK